LAKEALNEQGYGAVPTIGIAKKHSGLDFERVILPSEDTPLILPEYAPALKLLKRLRNEAHRFAVTFHRKRRQKRALASWLDNVKGVGRLTKKRLLMRFATPRSLLEASYEDLADAIHTHPKRALSLKRALQEAFPSS
jgi:excinuclease ABC subunit C